MAAEDWIKEWTTMSIREMNTLADTQKRNYDSMIDSQKRLEDKHDIRMNKIEESVVALSKDTSVEIGKLYIRIDAIHETLREMIKSNDLAIARMETRLIIICGGICVVSTAVTAAVISWLFGKM